MTTNTKPTEGRNTLFFRFLNSFKGMNLCHFNNAYIKFGIIFFKNALLRNIKRCRDVPNSLIAPADVPTPLKPKVKPWERSRPSLVFHHPPMKSGWCPNTSSLMHLRPRARGRTFANTHQQREESVTQCVWKKLYRVYGGFAAILPTPVNERMNEWMNACMHAGVS